MKKKSSGSKKTIPAFKTDKEAEDFLEQDLSDYLHAGNFKPVTFEFMPKTEKVNLRIPASLLTAIKQKAKKAKIPYQRYIRHVLENSRS